MPKFFIFFRPYFYDLGANTQRETGQFGSRKLDCDFHASGFCDVALDAKIEALASETDLDNRRNAEIAEFRKAAEERQLCIPIRCLVLNWSMKSGVRSVVVPDDAAMFNCLGYE